MLANPNARLTPSKFGEASVFGEAVQRLVELGESLPHVLAMLAQLKPKDLAEATSLARDIARDGDGW